jgi:hypothetical protein
VSRRSDLIIVSPSVTVHETGKPPENAMSRAKRAAMSYPPPPRHVRRAVRAGTMTWRDDTDRITVCLLVMAEETLNALILESLSNAVLSCVPAPEPEDSMRRAADALEAMARDGFIIPRRVIARHVDRVSAMDRVILQQEESSQ